jgi:hypothetical protein
MNSVPVITDEHHPLVQMMLLDLERNISIDIKTIVHIENQIYNIWSKIPSQNQFEYFLFDGGLYKTSQFIRQVHAHDLLTGETTWIQRQSLITS